jgi:hypothetical protein
MTATEITTLAVAILPTLSAFASAISACVPDARLGILAKFINVLALNIGHARNDPAVNGIDAQDQQVPPPQFGKDSQG